MCAAGEKCFDQPAAQQTGATSDQDGPFVPRRHVRDLLNWNYGGQSEVISGAVY
jgi:hypothetical protein